MDMVTDLPESTASGYSGISVIIDRITKMAIDINCRKHIAYQELALAIIEHFLCKRGVPNNIVTDRSTQFPTRFRVTRSSTVLHLKGAGPYTVCHTISSNGYTFDLP